MSNELEHQKMLKELLQIEYNDYNIPAKVYAVNEFKRADKHHAKKPDLIILGTECLKHRKIKEQKFMCSPIGIEFKEDGIGVTKFTRTIFDQVREGYFYGQYYLNEKKEDLFTISSWAYTTPNLIKNGQLLRTPYCECNTKYAFATDFKWAERICWAANMALLFNNKNKFSWSFRNCHFNLNGKEVAAYGKDAKLFTY